MGREGSCLHAKERGLDLIPLSMPLEGINSADPSILDLRPPERWESTFLLFKLLFKLLCPDFPGGPVLKTPPSNAGGAGLTPSQGAKISDASGPKKPRT